MFTVILSLRRIGVSQRSGPDGKFPDDDPSLALRMTPPVMFALMQLGCE
jgi:hypothetical protein